MQSSERDDFVTELRKLCAGFGVPFTKDREEGFWTGLARMSLLSFRRCVEHALGEDYAGDTFPKTGDIWRIYKGTALTPKPNVRALLPADPDHLAYYANRLLWLHVSHRGGLGSVGRFVPSYGMVDCKASDELQRCLKFKRELVEEFCGFIRDGDEMANPATFVRWWLAGLQKISEVLPRTVRNLEQLADDPESQKPFDVLMGRELTQREPALA
jgi:hypothetical protein